MVQGQKIGYARVSSATQHLDRQLVELERHATDRIFSDTVSGKNTERPGFEEMMRYLREDDELVVCSMDRLSRSLKDLLDVTGELRQRGVRVVFLKEGIRLEPKSNADPMTELIFAMMGAVAQFERSLIRERQQEGIELAKKKGIYKGQKFVDTELLEKAKKKIDAGVPVARVARELKLGRTTIYKYLKTTASKN